MKTSHYAVLAGALTSLALMINGLHDWHTALTPSFVAGILTLAGTQIGSLFTGSVTAPDPPSVSSGTIAKLGAVLLVLALVGSTTACTPKPPTTSPTPPAAVLTLTQAQKAIAILDVLRDTAISLNSQTPKLLSDSATAQVVTIHDALVKTIAAAPAGWQATATTALQQLKTTLPAADYQKISPYVIVAEAALAAAS